MNIVWSSLAIEQYFETLIYLKVKWGQVAVTNFVDKVKQKVQALETNPGICQRFPNSKHV